MATREEQWKEENQGWLDKGIDWVFDFFKQTPPDKNYVGITTDIQNLKKDEDATQRDYYDMLARINEYHEEHPDKGPGFSIDAIGTPWGNMMQGQRMGLLDEMDKKFPDRGKEDYNFREFEKAYAIKDPDKREKRIAQLRTQYDPKQRSPHIEKGRPFVESDVTEAILAGKLKRPEDPYEGPFGKLGEYFSKNAAARDKLFQYMSSIGKEMVKPIEPGQAAAGALLPTLSRGITKGEEEYASKQAAAAKTALDIASARQKISPLQYYSSKMQEARLAVPQGTDPDSAEGKRWIGKYLLSVGVPGQVVDLTSSLESLNLQKLSAQDDTERKRLQDLIDKINRQIQDLVSQSIGGSSVTNIIPYSP
jgi:hypothetical protein